MNLFSIKALSAAILWVSSLIFGVLLPYLFWKHSPRRKQFSRLLDQDNVSDQESNSEGESSIHDNLPRNSNICTRLITVIRTKFLSRNTPSLVYCLCGGVFLGVSLLDLIPESRLAVADALKEMNASTNYPLAEFAIALGLLFVLILENVITECMGSTETLHIVDSSPSQQCVRNVPNPVIRNVSSYRMYVLVLTLSVHSIFEGLAIGLQKDIPTLVQLVIAVSVHKAVISLSIGLALFQTLGTYGKIKTALFCAVIFCSASPAGCFAGAFVSENQAATRSSTLASAILQCIATGTFLYVTFLEVIPKEFSHHAKQDSSYSNSSSTTDLNDSDDVEASATGTRCRRNYTYSSSRLIKLIALIIGFSIASGLQFL